jgi:hypothetical protein
MIIHDAIQGTPEWDAVRLGKFTASRFSDLFMDQKTKGYQGLINQVVFERLTGEKPESFSSAWMDRGKELESDARHAYELETFRKVQRVGFVELDEWVGCSPDGFVGADGTVEIKCPKYSTLIDYHLTGKIPTDYFWQMQGGLYITGRAWCDFYVWHPKLKPILKRVYLEPEKIELLKSALNIAIDTTKTRIKRIAS